MNSYAYEAVNAAGLRIAGSLDVASQNEALRRIKEMGLFPTKIAERRRKRQAPASPAGKTKPRSRVTNISINIPFLSGRVKPVVVAGFTRQLATLIEAGMPLLRGLRILEQQEPNRTLKHAIGDVATAIESGGTLSEAVSAHPKIFNRLFVNMVKAGELSGALDVTLRRLAEFMEKAHKIKGKVKSAMFYPLAVLFVAAGVMAGMLIFIIPRFQQVFDGLLNGAKMPAFTRIVLQISESTRHHAPTVALIVVSFVVALLLVLQTKAGRWGFDRFKLAMPIFGKIFRKAAISRFARTLGTLLANGVPILQALNIVRETAGNAVVSNVITDVHDNVKEGESLTAPLRNSKVFPPVVVGMVDVGEQTGALPDMLLKIADNCDDDVDNAVNSMTSLLEPIMIVILGVIVGGIVIALFLPLIKIASDGFEPNERDA